MTQLTTVQLDVIQLLYIFSGAVIALLVYIWYEHLKLHGKIDETLKELADLTSRHDEAIKCKFNSENQR